MAKEINDVEGTGAVSKCMIQDWFRDFKKDDTSLKGKPRSSKPFVVEDEALLKMPEQQPSTCTLSAELCPSQSTINGHLYKLSLVNRHCQEDHELTNDQAQ